MVTDVRIVRGRDCVRATPAGTLDLDGSKRVIAEVAAVGGGLGVFDVILDVRRTDLALTITDLWYLADHLARQPTLRGRRIAVLPPAWDGERADTFAGLARARGMRVRAFVSFEAAIDWLVEGRSEPAVSPPP